VSSCATAATAGRVGIAGDEYFEVWMGSGGRLIVAGTYQAIHI
jgi:hypothetical protein